MPKSESAEFTVSLKLPEGTSLERTNSTAIKTEGIIKELLGEKVRLIYTQAGEDNTSTLSQSPDIRGENTASLKVILADEYASETESAINQVENYLKGDSRHRSFIHQGRECASVSTGYIRISFCP